MKELFTYINEFVRLKNSCVFCNAKLKIKLTNYVITENIPILMSSPVDGKFIFNLHYTNGSFELQTNSTIDMTTNNINFNIIMPEHNKHDYSDHDHVIEIFEDMKPHIELYSPNRFCKMKYSLKSQFLRCNNIHYGKLFDCIIRPFKLYVESFVVGNLLIHNDWNNNISNIYSRTNTTEPIKVSLIDLQSMSKEKVMTRVKTLVNFS